MDLRRRIQWTQSISDRICGAAVFAANFISHFDIGAKLCRLPDALRSPDSGHEGLGAGSQQRKVRDRRVPVASLFSLMRIHSRSRSHDDVNGDVLAFVRTV